MKAKLKLIYFNECPNAKNLRAHLVLSELPFEDICQDKLSSEDPLKKYSSPCILLENTIIFGSKVGEGGGCTFEELPSSLEIIERVEKISGSVSRDGSKLVASTGSIGSILAVILCPVCKPALAAMLGTLGLGFFAKAEVMQSALILFLAFSVGGFFFSYLKIHRNLAPFILSVGMSIALYLGRYFYFGQIENNILTYGGLTGLVMLSIWNFTLKKPVACGACPKTT
jgi:hypothetical protein